MGQGCCASCKAQLSASPEPSFPCAQRVCVGPEGPWGEERAFGHGEDVTGARPGPLLPAGLCSSGDEEGIFPLCLLGAKGMPAPSLSILSCGCHPGDHSPVQLLLICRFGDGGGCSRSQGIPEGLGLAEVRVSPAWALGGWQWDWGQEQAAGLGHGEPGCCGKWDVMKASRTLSSHPRCSHLLRDDSGLDGQT